MRIGIVGTGGVGRALIGLIDERSDMKLIFALNSRSGASSEEGLDAGKLYQYLEESRNLKDFGNEGFGNWTLEDVLNNHKIDFLVEATPTNKKTGEPAMSTIRYALENGIHVVTANKGPVMLNYRELKDLADEKRLGFGIGATAGAALPSISAGENDLLGARIIGIRGVLNGTTNYILSLMESEEVSYEEALKKAKDEGIAETDPSQDVEGWDTAIKMTIISNALLNTSLTLDDAKVTGITRLTLEDVVSAKRDGERFKLIGELKSIDGNPEIIVKPEKISSEDIFHGVFGKNKGIQYNTDNLGEVTILGGASDLKGAAASIIRDILQINEKELVYYKPDSIWKYSK